MKPKTTEAQHQSAVIAWANHPATLKKYPEMARLFHVPNGGSRNKLEAHNLKLQGVKPGVPDLFLPASRGGFHGLFIEMKSENGRLSEYQKDWVSYLSGARYIAKVAYGANDAIEMLKWYLNLSKERLEWNGLA